MIFPAPMLNSRKTSIVNRWLMVINTYAHAFLLILFNAINEFYAMYPQALVEIFRIISVIVAAEKIPAICL